VQVTGCTDGVGPLGRSVALGTLWVLVGFGAGRILGFATNIVLARLLEPGHFGLIGLAMIAIGGLALLQDLGVPAAIVYGEADVAVVGGTALTINVLAAVLLLGLVAVGAPLLAALAGDAAVGPVATVLAVGLVISSLGSVQGAVLTKELAFRRKFLPDVLPLVASGVTSIGLALLGFGVWSLSFGYLARALASTVLLWVFSGVRLWPRFDWPVAAALLRYGRHVSIAAVVGYAVMNVDYVIVGRMLGAAALGAYSVAFVIANLPYTAVGQVVGTATFPGYVRLRGDPAGLARLFADVYALVCALTVPMGAALLLCATALEDTVLGQKWAGVGAPLRVLVAFGVLRAIEQIVAPVYKAVGRPDLVWKFGLLRLAASAPLMLLAVGHGVVGIAAVQVLVAALFFPVNGVMLRRLVGVPPALLCGLAAPTLAGAAAMALAAAALSRTPLGAASAGPLGAALIALAALGAYACVLLPLSPRLVARRLCDGRRGRAPAASRTG
jgi:PST family polysaccharide transporter